MMQPTKESISARGATVKIFENPPTILYIMHAIVPCTYERRSRGELEKTGEKQRELETGEKRVEAEEKISVSLCCRKVVVMEREGVGWWDIYSSLAGNVRLVFMMNEILND
jgi:hypothetical protein